MPAKAKSIGPDQVVVWFAPETLYQQELAEKLAHADDPSTVLEILNSRPTLGEYRLHEGDELAIGDDGIQRLEPKFSKDRLVLINENPGDNVADESHFEVYNPDIHGDTYQPVIAQEAQS